MKKFRGSPVLLVQDTFFLDMNLWGSRGRLSVAPKQYANMWFVKHQLREGEQFSPDGFGDLHWLWNGKDIWAPIAAQGCVLNVTNGKIASFNHCYPLTRQQMRDTYDRTANTGDLVKQMQENTGGDFDAVTVNLAVT